MSGGENMIVLEKETYEMIKDYRDGFQEEALKERFSDVLSKYDYILGDWGYGQLRLKGFFDDKNPKATFDNKISVIEDYIYEYCNFGCPHFILKKVKKTKK